MGNFRHYKPQSPQIHIRERKAYDVFLSFRGPDVRKTFVDHLFQSLSTAGLNVFIDSEKLERGKNIEISLEQAIENSTIYIPIFSPGYPSSAWCLKEVSLMWKLKSTRTQKLLIPLFYKVDPSTVRHVSRSNSDAFDKHRTQGSDSPEEIEGWRDAPYQGSCLSEWSLEGTSFGFPESRGDPYAEAFDKHQTKGRHSPEEIEGWRNALYQVSCLSGWSLKETCFGHEGRLVTQVVNDVLRSLDCGMLHVAELSVGLIPRSEEVIQLLKLDDKTSDRLTLGILGMGGLGKTTLSKALYNKIRQLFQASCFVSNVKLEEPIQGLRKLQQQILRDLLNIQMKVNDIDHGKNLMRNHLASLRALVVLDDVDNVQQLNALMGDWFGEGSRIIITTRDKRVLEVGQVDVIYRMRGLELAEGVELFSWHAFLRPRPQEVYEHLTERIVKACSGLPLTLKVIGESLYDRKNQIYWEEAQSKLENQGYNDVFKPLKISYNTLDPMEKRIFLDIACFFVDLKSSICIQNRAFNRDFYVRFWSALGCEYVNTCLNTLEEKGLVEINEHRYSEAIDEDVDDEYDAGQYFCEFSMHDQMRDMGRRIVREESANRPTRRSRVWREQDIPTLMAGSNTKVNSNVEGFVWSRRMELQHIDGLAPMQKLNFLLWWNLQLKAEIKRLPRNLKYLVFSECQLKDYNPQIAGLESGNDHNGSSVLSSVLPKSINQLIYLLYLDMSGTKQSCLPKEICELQCLEELYLSRCNLEALPEAFGNLFKLKALDISDNFLSQFPPSFQRLKSLVNLQMARNEQLLVFPALPKGLTTLNARRCSKLQVISFPDGMVLLKTMDLSHCKSLTQLLALQQLKSLRNLNLDGCKQLVKLDPLPRTIPCLHISGCSQLENFSFPRHYEQAQKEGSICSPASYDRGLSEMRRLCMIGCDNIRLNIYRLLKDLKYLEQLDFSVPSGEKLPVETEPLVGQKYLIEQRHNPSVAVLVCFVFDSNENVCLPEMEVVMAFLGNGGDCSYSRPFKLPSCMKEDGSGKNILRVCVCKGFFEGGTVSCSYSVQGQLSQRGSPVLLKQVEILSLGSDATSNATSEITTQFLHQWKLLSSSNDIDGEEREEKMKLEKERRKGKKEVIQGTSSNDIDGEEREEKMKLEKERRKRKKEVIRGSEEEKEERVGHYVAYSHAVYYPDRVARVEADNLERVRHYLEGDYLEGVRHYLEGVGLYPGGNDSSTSSKRNRRPSSYFFLFIVSYVLVVHLALSNSK